VFPPVLTVFRTFIFATVVSLSSYRLSYSYSEVVKWELLFRFNIFFHIEPLLIYGCCIQLRECEFNYCCLDCKYS
jgi:hypothetical protein